MLSRFRIRGKGRSGKPSDYESGDQKFRCLHVK
jgi:hypothetical protein